MEYTPVVISHDQFMDIMKEIMSIDNRVQTLSSIIKLHTWSIYVENVLADVSNMFSTIDTVHKQIQDMILKLIKLHASNIKKEDLLSLSQ